MCSTSPGWLLKQQPQVPAVEGLGGTLIPSIFAITLTTGLYLILHTCTTTVICMWCALTSLHHVHIICTTTCKEIYYHQLTTNRNKIKVSKQTVMNIGENWINVITSVAEATLCNKTSQLLHSHFAWSDFRCITKGEPHTYIHIQRRCEQ